MGRRDSLCGRLQAIETNLIEDVVMSALLFVTISYAWAKAPDSWPQIVYYLAVAVGIFGYFRVVSPPPGE